MGDVAMTVPVIAAFLKTYPEVHVTLLSNPRWGAMFPPSPNFTYFPVDTKKEYAGNLGMVRLFKKLRKERTFDLMIDLHDVLRSKLLRTLYKLSGTPVYVINKGRKEKKKLTASTKRSITPLKSTINRYADVFRAAGYPLDSIESIKHLYENNQCPILLSAHTTIGIAPFAQHKGKIYPLEKIENIIAHFSKRADTQLLLFGGGEKEKRQLETWSATYDQTTSVAGKFSLQEELALLKSCDVVLSMDSANMHLASLVGTPVVSVWGATHPYAGFYGFQQEEGNAIQLDMPCRPCSIYGNKPCHKENYPCLHNIKEENIIQKIEEVIAKV